MMKVLTRRAVTVAVGGVAMVGLAAGPAAAHFCYKTSDTEQGAAGKAGSSGWMSFEDVAMVALTQEVGIAPCEEAIAYLAEVAGVELSTPINVRGTMAAGTLKKEESGTIAISHLSEEMFAAVPDAYALCGTGSTGTAS